MGNKRKGFLSTNEEQALREAIKEGLRVALLAAIPVILLGVNSGSIDLRLAGLSALVAVLRFIDSYLHQSGRAVKGLTRF